jgi:hypothetical protein
MTDQKVFAMETSYYSGGSCVPVESQYHRGIFVRVAPPRDTIYRIIKQSEGAGSMYDKGAKGCKRSASVRTEESVSAAREESPRNTVRS